MLNQARKNKQDQNKIFGFHQLKDSLNVDGQNWDLSHVEYSQNISSKEVRVLRQGFLYRVSKAAKFLSFI